ncbi:MAG: hypothetical protein AB7O32_07875, partial [Vicinamibacterales bacterium]
LVPVRVVVESPRRRDGNALDFNVGYLIAQIDWDGRLFVLHHMRIQNHLRKMGLARQALAMITGAPPRGWNMSIEVATPATTPSASEGVALDEALPTPDAIRRVKRIIQTLPAVRARRGFPA